LKFRGGISRYQERQGGTAITPPGKVPEVNRGRENGGAPSGALPQPYRRKNMRKILFLCLIVALLPLSASARMLGFYGGTPSSPPACAETCSGTYGNTWEDGLPSGLSAGEYVIERIQLTGSCAGSNPTVYISTYETGPVNNLKFVIYADNGGGGDPGSLICFPVAGQTISDSTLHWLNKAVTGGTCLSGYAWVGAGGDGVWYQHYKNVGTSRRYAGSYDSPPDPWPSESDTESSTTRGIYLSW